MMASSDDGVFISYSRVDAEFVRRLQESLAARDRKAWVDWQDIPPTAEWMDEIMNAIDASDAVVFVLSPDSVSSPVCSEEIQHALASNKRIVPVLCRDVEAATMPEAIAKLNWIVVANGALEPATDRVVEALDTDLERVRAHSRLLIRSREWVDKHEDKALLLRGSELDDAEALVSAAAEPQATAEQTRLVMTSRRAAATRQRGVISIAVVVAIVASSLGVLAWTQRGAAITQRNRAESQARIADSRRLANQAGSSANTDLSQAALLAIEAQRTAQTSDAVTAIHKVAQLSEGIDHVLRGPSGMIVDATFTPNGDVLAASGDSMFTWDPTSWEQSGAPIRTGQGDIGEVDFSPNGQLLASTPGGHVLLSDADSRNRIALLGPSGHFVQVAFRSNDSLLATSWDGIVQSWDPISRQPTNRFSILVHSETQVATTALSPDGRQLASATVVKPGELSASSLSMWDPATGNRRGQPLLNRSDGVRNIVALTFSPDGALLAAGTALGRVLLFDAKTHEQVGQLLLDNHDTLVTDLDFSPDGSLLAAGNDDRTVVVWDVRTHGSIGYPLRASSGVISSVAFSHDGAQLAVGDELGTVTLWNMTRVLENRDEVWAVAFSPDGQLVASASESPNHPTVDLWDAQTGREIGDPMRGHTDVIWGLVFSPDGSVLASGGYDGQVFFWDPRSGARAGPPLAVGHRVQDLAFSPDGKVLAIANRDGAIRLWDVATREQVGELDGHTSVVMSVAFSPDGNLLASGSRDHTIILWDVASQKAVGEPLKGHSDWVSSVAFSPDGKTLASGGFDDTVRLWDVATHRSLGRPLTGHTDWIVGVAFSPDGRELASASVDRSIIVWDVATGDPIGDPLQGHTDWVYEVEFNPAGTMLASASSDHTVRLWDARAWNEDLTTLSQELCDTFERNLTRAEWDEFLPSQPYRSTCQDWPAGA